MLIKTAIVGNDGYVGETVALRPQAYRSYLRTRKGGVRMIDLWQVA